MSNISSTNFYNTQNVSPEVLKKVQSEESFGSLDKDKLKQDTVEISKKAEEQVKENFVFKILRNTFGVKNPKQFLISAGLTIGTIVSFTIFGTKFNKKFTNLGLKIDDKLDNSKTYGKISRFFSGVKRKTGDFVDKSDFIKDIKETLTTKKLGPENVAAKTSALGPKYQFASNVVDNVQAIHNQELGDSLTKLKKYFGNGFAHAPKARTNALEFVGLLQEHDLSMENILKLKDDLSESKVQEIIKNFTELSQSTLGKFELINEQNKLLKRFGFNEDNIASVRKGFDNIINCNSKCEKLKKTLGEQEALDLINELKDGNKKTIQLIKKLVGEDSPDLEYYIRNFMEIKPDPNRVNFCRKLTGAIGKHNGCDSGDIDASKKLSKILFDLKDGEMGDEFLNITMNRESIAQAWTLPNFVDKIGKKIFKNKWKPYGKGNLGEALLRYNMTDGTLAKTTAGKLSQKLPVLLGESISNNVADRALINMIVEVPLLMGLFNRAQEAPKEQKVGTLADEFIGGLGTFALSMPTSCSIVYGLASLKNLKGNNPLKLIGNIFGMGLNSNNGFARTLGGALRFWLVMFIVSPKISGAIKKVTTKIFGKPYDETEAKKEKEQAEQAEQAKAIIPELGITQGEFLEKLQKNPQAIQELQTNPKLMQMAQKDPKIILDLLDGKPVDTLSIKPFYDGSKIISPMNAQIVKNNNVNTTNTISNIQKTKNKSKDTATYIPSSDFIVQNTMSEEQQEEYNEMMTNAEKALKRAQKYL